MSVFDPLYCRAHRRARLGHRRRSAWRCRSGYTSPPRAHRHGPSRRTATIFSLGQYRTAVGAARIGLDPTTLAGAADFNDIETWAEAPGARETGSPRRKRSTGFFMAQCVKRGHPGLPTAQDTLLFVVIPAKAFHGRRPRPRCRGGKGGRQSNRAIGVPSPLAGGGSGWGLTALPWDSLPSPCPSPEDGRGNPAARYSASATTSRATGAVQNFACESTRCRKFHINGNPCFSP